MEGSKAGAVVRAFVIHHCSPGLIPGPGVICRFVVGSRPSTDDFSLGFLPTFQISVRPGQEEPLPRDLVEYSLLDSHYYYYYYCYY